MTDNCLTLFCLVDGRPTSNAFSVEIDQTKTVDHLRDLIKAKKSIDFKEIDADKLTLWRVSIPIPDDDDETPVSLNSLDDKKKLGPVTLLSKVFYGDLPGEMAHILVQVPPPAVDLSADVTFSVSVKGKDPEPWNWETTPLTATLDDFRQNIYAKYCIPEDERRGIVIEHAKCLLFRDGGIDRVLGDARLRTILKMYVTAGLRRLDVHLEYQPKGHSKFTLEEVYERLGVERFDGMEVGRTPCNTEERKAVLEDLKSAINLVRRASDFKNEACTSTFVAPFFQAAVVLHQGLSLSLETDISGRWGTGPVDYAIESRNTMEMYVAGVAEVKTTKTFLTGLQQNVIQLDSALTSCNIRDLRSDTKPLVAYGIVTDACRWQFVECCLKPMEDTEKLPGPSVVRISEVSVKVDYNSEKWAEQVEEVFEYILWFVGMMSRDTPTTKRFKGNSAVKEP